MISSRLQIGLLTLTALAIVAALFAPWQQRSTRSLVALVATLRGQWVGRSAPTFTLPDLQGAPHSLEGMRGKVVFLNVWASFCEPCRKEMPSMERLVREYQDRGLVMVAMSVDPEAADAQAFMQTFLPGQRSAMAVLHDAASETAHAYGTELLPETYIIDRSGRIVARFVNAYDSPCQLRSSEDPTGVWGQTFCIIIFGPRTCFAGSTGRFEQL